MGILDQLVGQVLGGPQGSGGSRSGGFADVLMRLLAGQTQDPNRAGGLAGLIERFRNGGLGHAADSWVSTGPNQPISPNQLRNVFNENEIQSMSRQAGMPQDDFLSELSQHLPRVVDRATPRGELPEEGTISV